MGFFGLFRKKPALDTSRLVINVTENGIDINEAHITLPCDINLLKHLLGEARKTEHRSYKTDHRAYNPENPNPKIFNYTWDKIGLYCHSYDDKLADCICARTSGEIDCDFLPEETFSGIFTINSINWFDIMKKSEIYWFSEQGEGIPRLRYVRLGRYLTLSRYADEDSDGGVNSYEDLCSIEVEIK